MNTKTITKKTLIQRYHAIAARLGMSAENRKDFLSAWGVTSSVELSREQLLEVVTVLSREVNKLGSDADTWRKRVIAAIFALMRQMNVDCSIDYVKAVACRAAGAERFNAIPVTKLRALYNSFRKETETMRNAKEITTELSAMLAALN